MSDILAGIGQGAGGYGDETRLALSTASTTESSPRLAALGLGVLGRSIHIAIDL